MVNRVSSYFTKGDHSATETGLHVRNRGMCELHCIVDRHMSMQSSFIIRFIDVLSFFESSIKEVLLGWKPVYKFSDLIVKLTL